MLQLSSGPLGRNPKGESNMRYTIAIIAFLSSFFCSPVFSQGHYPLQIGNKWDYGYLDPPPAGHFTYVYSLLIARDTVMANGSTYAVEESIYGTRFLRNQDSVLLQYVDSRDTVIYDYSYKDGDTALFVQSGQYVTTVVVHVGQGETFGRTLTSWTYVRTSNTSSDAGSMNALVDSIGRTYTFIDGGYTEYLIGARLNGKVYGTVLSAPLRTPDGPASFQLFQSYPNPFNPTTSIKYSVPVRSKIHLAAYSILGIKVADLFDGLRTPGVYTATLDGSRLSSGIYIVRLITPDFTISNKILLLK
jgi:hypothetical protein